MRALWSGSYSTPCCNINGDQSNAWGVKNGYATECGHTAGQFICDVHGGRKTANIYYHNPEYGINVTYFGYYHNAFAHKPVGWRPREQAAFLEEYAWNDAYMPQEFRSA